MKKPKKNHTLRENDKIHKNYKMRKNPIKNKQLN